VFHVYWTWAYIALGMPFVVLVAFCVLETRPRVAWVLTAGNLGAGLHVSLGV
jgi:hypothetical protein